MSIVEVAKLAGLSHATVSRVINDRPGVSNNAAERVRSAMKKLGYTPPAKRRGPVPKSRPAARTGNIALLMLGTDLAPMHAPVAAVAVDAAGAAVSQLGFNLTLCRVGDDGALPPILTRGDIDGLILHGYPPAESVALRLREFPTVWMMSRRTEGGDWGDRVSPDNEAVGRIAAEHLLGEGHRHVAYLRVEQTHRGFTDREVAFVESIRGTGADCDLLDVAARDDGERGAHLDRRALDAAIKGLSEQSTRATAVFVPRGRWTMLVYEALRQHGLEPGRDIAVIACDNDPILAGLSPAPVTIDIQPDLIGSEAVRQLMRRLEEPESRSVSRMVVRVQPRLVVGDLSEAST
ncbi:MAG: LacI family DNA-binding transcriptional regulator [Planctomycetota bacterium]